VVGQRRFAATLTHSPVAAALWDLLPLQSRAQPAAGQLVLPLQNLLPQGPDQREELGIGELAYRADDACLVVYLGATGSSRAGEPRAERGVSPVGMLEEQPEPLADVPPGTAVTLMQLDERRASAVPRRDDPREPAGPANEGSREPAGPADEGPAR
jgi:hypothetical protein